jgi:hypothetical protein
MRAVAIPTALTPTLSLNGGEGAVAIVANSYFPA